MPWKNIGLSESRSASHTSFNSHIFDELFRKAFAIIVAVVAPLSLSSSALAIIVKFVSRRTFAIVVNFVACCDVAIIVNFVAR